MEHTKEEEIKMMRTPANWPVWPFLPLKRVNLSIAAHDLGFMVEDRNGVEPRVYIGNMITREYTEQMLFDSWDSLYESGWRVD